MFVCQTDTGINSSHIRVILKRQTSMVAQHGRAELHKIDVLDLEKRKIWNIVYSAYINEGMWSQKYALGKVPWSCQWVWGWKISGKF